MSFNFLRNCRTMKFFEAKRTADCKKCNFCKEAVCPSIYECIGCGACFIACPNNAVEMVERRLTASIKININGRDVSVPEKITVKQALEIHGYKFTKYPGEEILASCEVGGCCTCSVKIDENDVPSCVTPVKEGMKIDTETEKDTPKRLIYGFAPHGAGGVGTPFPLKGLKKFIELVCFTCGCNLRCPQCQNWMVSYRGKPSRNIEGYKTPEEVALRMSLLRKRYGLDRMTISGGESTLNRTWLISFIIQLKRLNSDSNLRIHIDTNGSILTEDYIDELVEAGMTDIGIDLKGLELETFIKITGLEDNDLADKYLATAWHAVEYINTNYKENIFLGLGIPYNREFITLDQIRKIGQELFKIDPEFQVCLIDYRGEFRNKMTQPGTEEMRNTLKILKECGLKKACCQTREGYFAD